jgi:hypothetical protein
MTSSAYPKKRTAAQLAEAGGRTLGCPLQSDALRAECGVAQRPGELAFITPKGPRRVFVCACVCVSVCPSGLGCGWTAHGLEHRSRRTNLPLPRSLAARAWAQRPAPQRRCLLQLTARRQPARVRPPEAIGSEVLRSRGGGRTSPERGRGALEARALIAASPASRPASGCRRPTAIGPDADRAGGQLKRCRASCLGGRVGLLCHMRRARPADGPAHLSGAGASRVP